MWKDQAGGAIKKIAPLILFSIGKMDQMVFMTMSQEKRSHEECP
jgi:hypothetical protein